VPAGTVMRTAAPSVSYGTNILMNVGNYTPKDAGVTSNKTEWSCARVSHELLHFAASEDSERCEGFVCTNWHLHDANIKTVSTAVTDLRWFVSNASTCCGTP